GCPAPSSPTTTPAGTSTKSSRSPGSTSRPTANGSAGRLTLVGWGHAGLRRVLAGVVRRPGRPRRRDAVPGERHQGAGGAAGQARRGGPPLRRVRRGEPHPRPVPRPALRDREGLRRGRPGPAPVLGEP